MNYTAYIQRQKNLIRTRHYGEVYFSDGVEEYSLSEVEELLRELDNLKGLNKTERALSAK